MSKKSTTELLSHHMCVRGGSNLQCCGNYSYVGEVQYRDDLPNSECCGQLVYDEVDDHCCAVQGYNSGFDNHESYDVSDV
jgi:hypothetical protein